MSAGGGQKRGPLELRSPLKVFVTHPVWMLGTRLRSSKEKQPAFWPLLVYFQLCVYAWTMACMSVEVCMWTAYKSCFSPPTLGI